MSAEMVAALGPSSGVFTTASPEKELVPPTPVAATRYRKMLEAETPSSSKLVSEGVATWVNAPPEAPGARSTTYPVAPEAELHDTRTMLGPRGDATSPPGTGGGSGATGLLSSLHAAAKPIDRARPRVIRLRLFNLMVSLLARSDLDLAFQN
jgi:hypothetical protein